ncbi:MAG: DUF2779 domain-containing protein [Actinomycetia bacterium]|nr:DUF2779 domain-containing protein [Actinomycetes bacterium]
MVQVPGLSKSRFQAGLQCPKRLWLECHAPELADPTSEVQQALFDTGHRVGELARDRFPGGVLVGEDHTQGRAACRTTERLIREGAPCLYEAAFEHDGVLVRVDVLRRNEAGQWDLIEVKSSNSLQPEHTSDAAVQAYVAGGAGLPLSGTYLLHLNRDCVYPGGSYDLEELFTLEDLSGLVEEYLPAIPGLLRQMKVMLAGDCPEVRIGRHCENPHRCQFRGYCRGFLPEYPVTDLPRLADEVLAEFLEQGICSVLDVPLSHPRLTPSQRRVCADIQGGRLRVEPGLTAELAGLRFPVYFLDFETIMPALPLYVGTGPYQGVPVQWSCHILQADGTLEHHEFLHRERTDPRPSLTESLAATLGGPGSVVSYSDYEGRILEGLAQSQPQWAAEMADIRSRLFDLREVVGRYVGHPDLHGRTSLKLVLPALVEGLSYQGLAVPDGEVAMLRYQEAVWGELPQAEREAVFQDLLAYCATDTLGMVEIYRRLAFEVGLA